MLRKKAETTITEDLRMRLDRAEALIAQFEDIESDPSEIEEEEKDQIGELEGSFSPTNAIG